jgi:hypothetical protein
MAKRIQLTTSLAATSVDVIAEASVTCKTPADFVDVLEHAILNSLRSKTTVPEGKYNVRLLCVVTEDTNGPDKS